jgi:DNA-binding HxlR family transcriptional regulator
MSERDVHRAGRRTRPGAPLALQWAVELLGDRWSLLVVDALLAGPRRFSELGELVEGVAPNILTKRLRALEQAGLVHATPYQRRPPRFQYQLTERGHELADVLTTLQSWGSRHGERGDPARHPPCGTALETRPYCPTCDRVVDPAEQLIWL